MTKESLGLVVKCKQCLYFSKHCREGKTCEESGQQAMSRACSYFVADPYSINFQTDKAPVLLSKLLNKLDTKELPLFAAIIRQEEQTRKNGFYFGQEVFARVFGVQDYISNYAKGNVILATTRYVFLQGFQGYRAMLSKGVVLSEEQFKDKKRRLLRTKKIIDPNIKKYTSNVLKEQAYKDENYIPGLLKKLK